MADLEVRPLTDYLQRNPVAAAGVTLFLPVALAFVDALVNGDTVRAGLTAAWLALVPVVTAVVRSLVTPVVDPRVTDTVHLTPDDLVWAAPPQPGGPEWAGPAEPTRVSE